MKCSQCGKEIPENSNFCEFCGACVKACGQTENSNNTGYNNSKERKNGENNQNSNGQNFQGNPNNGGQNNQYGNNNGGYNQNYQSQGYRNQYNGPYRNNNNGYAPVKTNTFCIVGLVLAIASFFINYWGLLSAVSLVLSIVGVYQCSKTGEDGKVMGIVGIILSSIDIFLHIGLGILTIFLPFVFPFFLI